MSPTLLGLQEVDLLLNDGSKQINILGWRKNASLPQRVEASRRRSRRCLLMTLALAKTAIQQVLFLSKWFYQKMLFMFLLVCIYVLMQCEVLSWKRLLILWLSSLVKSGCPRNG